ncbi:MAG: hypothetical protein U0R24_10965 [Solirubrobacterales bacterium]
MVSVALSACGGSGDSSEEEASIGCGEAPASPSVTMTYQVAYSSDGGVAETADVICDRLEARGLEGQVSNPSDDSIDVTLARDDARDFAAGLISQGSIYFYDFEPSVVPLTAGLKLGEVTPGDLEEQSTDRQLDAVEVASRQPPSGCDDCSSPSPSYYLFDEDGKRLAGPTSSKVGALALAAVDSPSSGQKLLDVPIGTIVVSDSTDGSETRYFVLRDDPALSGADITDPVQGIDQATNAPNVSFGFTDEGAAAFQAVTRDIAQRGLESGGGEPYSLAVVVDDEIVSRPIIDPNENPDGIDGSTGAQISGGLTATEAQQLAATLQAGSLPASLQLTGVSTG